MKNKFVLACMLISLLSLPVRVLRAQTDKEIIKAADIDIKDKDYDLAFKRISTVSDPGKKKVQEILKKSYPNLVAEYVSKAGAVKLNDKDSSIVKREKLEEIIGYLSEGIKTDSILKKLAKPDLYKTLSKKKKMESTLKTSKGKLKTLNENIAKQIEEKRLSDSLLQDSIMQSMPEIQPNIDDQKTDLSLSDSQPSDINGGKKFYIIAGSYANETDAQAAVNTLISKGYASEIVGQNAYGNYRISYCGYADKDEALLELEKIRQIQSDVWLFEK